MSTKGLSDQLQSTHINMAKAAELATSTLETLQNFQSDDEWEKLYQYVKNVADLHNITESPPRPQRKRQMPQRCNVGIVMETTGSRESTDSTQ